MNGIFKLFHHKTHNKSDTGENHSYEPESHNNGFFGPSDGFEVVVKWGNTEDFLSVSEFLGGKLDDDRTDF